MKVWASKARKREQAEVIAHLTSVKRGRRTDVEDLEPEQDRKLFLAKEEEPLIVGDAVTTFGSEPWWTPKNWNKLSSGKEMRDLVVQNGVHADLAVVGATYCGRRHQLRGDPNDDSFRIAPLTGVSGSWVVAAVSDGVGSARYGAIGSSVASEHAVALIMHSLRKQQNVAISEYAVSVRQQIVPFLTKLTEAVQQHMQNSLQEWIASAEYTPPTDTDLKELQATLTAVAVRAEPNDDGNFDGVLIAVGDSPALVLRDGSYRPLLEDRESDGLHATATQGVFGATDANVKTFSLSPHDVLLLTTDGLASFLMHEGGNTALGNHIAARWAQPIEATCFARDISFDLASADDDRTAIAIWPRTHSSDQTN